MLLGSNITSTWDAILTKHEFTREFLSGINNVDIDKEMADLAENSIMYKFAAKKLQTYFRTLQEVIKGG